MEIFNKSNSRSTGKLGILTSHMLISPQNSSTRNLSIQISMIPKGSQQPVHAHDPEQCYYIINGTGLMIIEDETREVTSGDAIYIPANKKHGMKNIGDMVLEYLTANTPAFSKEHEDSLWPSAPV
jgi:mannose-6-phosphate isomerase-like protein (cupin superfamily)